MKTSKKLKAITLILVIILITILAFVGVYNISKVYGNNLIKDYNVGMELEGKKLLRLKVDDTVNTVIYDSEGNVVEKKEEGKEYTEKQEPVNNAEALNKDNYKKAKEIIEERLKAMEAQEYTIRFNEENGTIELELIEDELTDYLIAAITLQGDFKIIDDETKEVIMDRTYVKSANVVYTATSANSTNAYIDIEFNKEGAKKLEEMSRTYIKTTEQVVNEDGQTEDKTKEKKVAVKVDDNTMISTYFSEPLTNGHMYISVGQAASNNEELKKAGLQAAIYASVIKTDTIPVVYATPEENTFLVSNINQKTIPTVAIIALIVEAVVLIVVFRVKGILAAILQIGYVALLLLVVNYTYVYITIEGLFAIVLASILNMLFISKVLSDIKNKESISKAINDNLKKFVNISIPVLIVAIVFCFVNWLEISSFGMIIFWGYVVSILYSIIFTKGILKNIL